MANFKANSHQFSCHFWLLPLHCRYPVRNSSFLDIPGARLHIYRFLPSEVLWQRHHLLRGQTIASRVLLHSNAKLFRCTNLLSMLQVLQAEFFPVFRVRIGCPSSAQRSLRTNSAPGDSGLKEHEKFQRQKMNICHAVSGS